MIQWPETDWSKAIEQVNQWRHQGEVIVFTNGCFDLIHPGHIQLLSTSKSFGDRLIVGLNSDDSVKRLKGLSRPIKDEQSRGAVLAALNAVDLVILFDQDTPLELIQTLKPDILVKGGDYALEDIVGAKEILAQDGQVKIVPLLEGYSTSNWVDS